MKNFSVVLNVVLLIAVAYLYVLHFKDHKSDDSSILSTVSSLGAPHGGILYVNSDSLLDEYEYYKNKKSEIAANQDKIRNELKSESDKLQGEVERYQQEASTMTDAQRAQKEEQLSLKQQQLMQRKEELVSRLEDQRDKSSEELYTRLNDYLKRNKIKNCNYVLGFQKGGGILFANDSLNITRQVVEGLNKEYKAETK